MSERGKEIFENRVEYPLPKKSGLRDYIFFFVPAGDPYGRGARAFFNLKFYPDHHRHEVTSLEQLVSVLAAEPTGSKIRELVIVAHASPAGLKHRVLTAASETTTPEYRVIKPETLSLLQYDFAQAKFATFKAKRANAIARFDAESWITMRGCRLGSSPQSMYALYSFFGGRPNLYAPKEYQFFGTQPIMPGMRIENRLEVHEHLARQHFLPLDTHTPDRQDRIVRALVEPGRFKEPFVLATMRLSGASADETQTYEALVDSLDKGQINHMRALFTAAGQTLSSKAFSYIRKRSRAWTILDEATHGGGKYRIEYLVNEEFDDPVTLASLTVSARVAESYSAREQIPIQLFFDSRENDEFHGHVVDIAGYSDNTMGTVGGKADFDAVFATLERGLLTDDAGSALIRTAFQEALLIDLPPTTTLQELLRQGDEPLVTITWSLRHDDKRHLVKLGHLDDPNGYTAHRIAVFRDFDAKGKLRYELEEMATLGDDADTPGTELQAYFDRFTIDELTEVIDHLRHAYRPAHSFYIAEAMSAITRKHDHFSWWWNKYGQAAGSQPLVAQPYASLETHEADDLAGQVHGLNFNATWTEVKASHPNIGPFVNDLFAEENLWTKLGEDDLPSRDQVAILDDSPSSDMEALRALEVADVEEYFAREKSTFEPTDTTDEAGIPCEELATIFAKYNELAQTGDAEEVKRQLGTMVASDKKTFLEHVMIVWGLYSFGNKLWSIVNVSGSYTPTLFERIVLYRVVDLPPPSLIGTPGLASGLLTAAVPISIAWYFWSKYLVEEEKAATAWEALGKRTAIRQWLRELIRVTLREPYVETFNINLRNGSESFYIDRYHKERLEEHRRYDPFVWRPDRMRKGFLAGEAEMLFAGERIREQANQVLDQVLRENHIDACMAKVLRDAGVFDIAALRPLVIRAIAQALLDKIPNV